MPDDSKPATPDPSKSSQGEKKPSLKETDKEAGSGCQRRKIGKSTFAFEKPPFPGSAAEAPKSGGIAMRRSRWESSFAADQVHQQPPRRDEEVKVRDSDPRFQPFFF